MTRNKELDVCRASLVKAAWPLALLAGLVVLLVGVPFGYAQPYPSINVKDFGAKGDGVTDDTAAIQAAVRSIQTKYVWGSRVTATPEVIFPAGTYVISQTIAFPGAYLVGSAPPSMPGFWRIQGFTFIRGIGNAVIKQTNATADVFYIQCASHTFIDNVTFQGGRRSLKLFTSNLDQSHVVIQNCAFVDSGDYAVECVVKGGYDPNYQVPPGTVDPSSMQIVLQQYSRYELNGDGSIQSYIADDSQPYYYNSTRMHINGCTFTNCLRLVHSNCDGCYIENSSMETSSALQGPAIRNGGIMKVDNVTAVAHVTPGYGQHWVENFAAQTAAYYCPGDLILRDVTLTSASGYGLCPVYNTGIYRCGWGNGQPVVILEGCDLSGAVGCPENCIVYCQEVPNQISIRNCRVSGDTIMPALGFASVPSASYFTWTNVGRNEAPTGLAFTVDANNVNIMPNLPASMRPFARVPLPNDTDAMIRNWLGNKESFLSDAIMDVSGLTVIHASDYGVKGDGSTDDTAAINNAIAALSGRPGEIQFSAGLYKLSSTIVLPENTTIRGMGWAGFFASNGSTRLFRVTNAQRVAIYNCAFYNTSNVALITTTTSGAKVLIKNCLFAGGITDAIQVTGGTGLQADQSFLAKVRITDCTFNRCRKVLVSNVSALCDDIWISAYTGGGGYAALENYGTLRFESSLCVPQGGDYRWVTNYGRVIYDTIRSGGEAGGACIVENRRLAGCPTNVVVLQNSQLFNYDSHGVGGLKALVYLTGNPDQLVLRSNYGMEDPFVNTDEPGTVVLPNLIPGSAGQWLNAQLSGNTVPETVSTFVMNDFIEGQVIGQSPQGWTVTGGGSATIAAGSSPAVWVNSSAQLVNVMQSQGAEATDTFIDFTPIKAVDGPTGTAARICFSFRINAAGSNVTYVKCYAEGNGGLRACDVGMMDYSVQGYNYWLTSGSENLYPGVSSPGIGHWYRAAISLDLKARKFSTMVTDLTGYSVSQNTVWQPFGNDTVNQVDRLHFHFPNATNISLNDIRVEAVPSTAGLTGTVALGDFVGNPAAVPVTVQWRQGGTVMETDNVTLNAAGQFTLTGVSPGTYDMWIKASHWMAKLTSGLTLGGSTSLGTIYLVNGDCDGSNDVNGTDLAIVLAGMGARPGDTGWDTRADLDGDGEITSTDMSIVLAAMGTQFVNAGWEFQTDVGDGGPITSIGSAIVLANIDLVSE